MIKYLLPMSLSLSLALGGFAWWQHRKAAQLSENIQTLTQELGVRDKILRQHAAATQIHRKYIEQLEIQAAELQMELKELDRMEGRDAPLSDLLRATGDAVDRLR